MKKIVYLPLDERPCNADFPRMLFGEELKIVVPEKMGYKKQSACVDELIAFLESECADADGLVLAVDTLLYGGLIPSRLHHLSKEIVQERLRVIRRLKEKNPKLLVYAFHTIMRCPSGSCADEEPDYYGEYGREIWLTGVIRHKAQLGLDSPEEKEELKTPVSQEYLDDYLSRRSFNLEFVMQSLDFAKDGTYDFMVIPQDDSAPYGFTAIDQQKVRTAIAEQHLQMRVLMYPGADEVGHALISHMALAFAGKKPHVYVQYSSVSAPFIVPDFEDRPFGETVKYHLAAAGCLQTPSRDEADFILAINCPSSHMLGAYDQPTAKREYTVERNLPEFVMQIEDCLEKGRIVTVGDIAYSNGADLEFVRMLNDEKLLLKVDGYAGWNTSANTIGTAIAEGVHCLLYGRTKAHDDFMLLRYLEDAGYCSCVRLSVSRSDWFAQQGFNYFYAGDDFRGTVSEKIKAELYEYAGKELSNLPVKLVIDDCYQPWKRMFEVGLRVHGEKK